jgi:hypothetical protein
VNFEEIQGIEEQPWRFKGEKNLKLAKKETIVIFFLFIFEVFVDLYLCYFYFYNNISFCTFFFLLFVLNLFCFGEKKWILMEVRFVRTTSFLEFGFPILGFKPMFL